MQEKWLGLLHHVQNEHEWIFGRYKCNALINLTVVLVFERCEHDVLTSPPTDADGKVLEYFSKNEKPFRVLRKLIMDDKWLQSMKYYTKFRSVNIHIH